MSSVGLATNDCFRLFVSTTEGFNIAFAVVLVDDNDTIDEAFDRLEGISSLSKGGMDASRVAISTAACRRGRRCSIEPDGSFCVSYFAIRVAAVVDEDSFGLTRFEGTSIKIERIAPTATSKCSHRTDASDGRVHRRL